MNFSDCFKFDNYLWISLTQKCQWKCWYCDHPSIINPQTCSEDDLKQLIDILIELKDIRKDVEILLEGGEIGLLDEKLLDLIFYSNVSDKYSITTNGLFMKKGFHNRYKDKINYLLYHVVPEIEFDSEFEYYQNGLPIQYTVVVHKNNIQQFQNLLDKNPNCMFLPHFLQPRRNDLNFMNKDDFKRIYEIIKDKDNVFDFIKLRVKLISEVLDRKESLKRLQLSCQKKMTKTIINLPTKKIHRCCVSMNSSSVELNKENLIKILNGENIFDNSDTEMCLNCISSNVFMKLYNMDNIKYFQKVFKL